MISSAATHEKHLWWKCRCDCGNETSLRGSRLRSGESRSCGCASPVHKYRGVDRSLYSLWLGIRRRCLSKSEPLYKYYGGRGITISKEWGEYKNFLRDMSPRPVGMWVERVDVNGPYSKENCKWATPREQGRNRRNNRLITINNETNPLVVWCEIAQRRQSSVSRRLRRGLSPEDAIFGSWRQPNNSSD